MIVEWLMGAALSTAALVVVGVVIWETVKAIGRCSRWSFSSSYRRKHRAAAAARDADLRAAAIYQQEFREWAERERVRYRREYAEYERRLTEHRTKYPATPRRGVRDSNRPWGTTFEGESKTWNEASDRYGNAHKSLRAVYKRIIAAHGADCMEAVCIMPSRRIPSGASGGAWDLAHDHATGGRYDYLGPAHKQCNQAEALARGVSWHNAPTLGELLNASEYQGTEYEEALAHEGAPTELPPAHPEPQPPAPVHPAHPDHPENRSGDPSEAAELFRKLPFLSHRPFGGTPPPPPPQWRDRR